MLGLTGAARGENIFVGAIARGARTKAEVDEAIRPDRQIATDLFGEVDEFILNDQGRGLGVLDDKLNFLGRQAKVDGQRNQAGLCRRRIDFAPLDAVVGEDRDTIAFGQTEADQGIGQTARPFVPLGESHRTFQIPGADAVWRQPRMDREHLSEVQEVLHALLLSGSKIKRLVQCSRPMDIWGTAAMTMVPISSASM